MANMAPAHSCPAAPDISDHRNWTCCRLALRAGFTRTDDLVAVFFFDQDVATDAPCRMDLRTECRRLKHAGLGKFINHGKGFRLHERSTARPRLGYKPSRSGDSNASISFDEMQANVGITDDPVGFPASRARVSAARAKTRWFGSGLRDTRATLAFTSLPRRAAVLATA